MLGNGHQCAAVGLVEVGQQPHREPLLLLRLPEDLPDEDAVDVGVERWLASGWKFRR